MLLLDLEFFGGGPALYFKNMLDPSWTRILIINPFKHSQFTAETAFDMVSPGPSSVRSRRHKKSKKKRLHRPQDIRQGFGNAYLIVKDVSFKTFYDKLKFNKILFSQGINERVNTVIENTIVEHDQKGYTGAAGAIIRQVPPIVLAPVVLATQATTNILGGVKNQLVPDAKYEAREKWKDDSD